MIIDKALDFATEKHKGQKYNGKSYIVHPVLTYRIVKAIFPHDFELQAAAILHDTLEDTPTTASELAETFGSDIASLVYEVTKTDTNTFPNLKTTRGVILKFADRLANLSCMDKKPMEWQLQYINKSKFWR